MLVTPAAQRVSRDKEETIMSITIERETTTFFICDVCHCFDAGCDETICHGLDCD